MGVNELRSQYAHRETAFNLRYESNISWIPDSRPPRGIIHSLMKDPHHDLELYIGVSLANMQIDDIGIVFNRSPFPMCRDSVSRYNEFIGIEMSETKILRKLEEFEKRNCLHMNELFQLSVKAFTSGFAFYLKNKNIPGEMDEYRMHIGNIPLLERIETMRHWWMKDRRVLDSCYAYRWETIEEDVNGKIENLKPITRLMIDEVKANNEI